MKTALVLGLLLLPQALPPSPAPDPTGIADRFPAWDSLTAAQQAIFRREAEYLFVASDGSIWSGKVALDVERLRSRSNDPIAREQITHALAEGAPTFVNVATGVRRPSLSAIVDAIHNADLAEARGEQAAKVRAYLAQFPGELIERVHVVQVQPDGLLVRFPGHAGTEGRNVWLSDFPYAAGVVDGQEFNLPVMVESVGRRQYTSVLGARTTVEAFVCRKVLDDLDTRFPLRDVPRPTIQKITPEDLYAAYTAGRVRELPHYRLYRRLLRPTQVGQLYRGTRSMMGGRPVDSRARTIPPEYKWEWKLQYAVLRVSDATKPVRDVGDADETEDADESVDR